MEAEHDSLGKDTGPWNELEGLTRIERLSNELLANEKVSRGLDPLDSMVTTESTYSSSRNEWPRGVTLQVAARQKDSESQKAWEDSTAVQIQRFHALVQDDTQHLG
jgi:hypothetical protein